jgi:hypothetical protein
MILLLSKEYIKSYKFSGLIIFHQEKANIITNIKLSFNTKIKDMKIFIKYVLTFNIFH